MVLTTVLVAIIFILVAHEVLYVVLVNNTKEDSIKNSFFCCAETSQTKLDRQINSRAKLEQFRGF
jgi:hypothetical protein